jgi:hypothetical protein
MFDFPLHSDDGTTSRLPTSPVNSRLFSRVGHSMIHDPNLNSLFIFAGGRLESYLSDLWSIKLPPTPSTSTAFVPLLPVLISSDYSTSGPPAGFTQRATIDTRTGDWTILSGMVKDPKGNGGVVDTGVWTRSVEGEWEKVVEKGGEVPDARFGGQFVYDPLRGEYWLMGGNPQDHETSTRRMGDLWRLRVERSSPEEALRMAKFLIRKQRYVHLRIIWFIELINGGQIHGDVSDFTDAHCAHLPPIVPLLRRRPHLGIGGSSLPILHDFSPLRPCVQQQLRRAHGRRRRHGIVDYV